MIVGGRRIWRRWTVGCGLLMLACGHGPHDREIAGMLGVPANGRFALDVLIADTTIDGAAIKLVTDTGSPFTLLDPSVATGAVVSSNVTVGGVTVKGVQVIGTIPFSIPGTASGLLGGNLLCQFPTTFDYRMGQLRLGYAAPPPDVAQPGTVIAFHAEGGGGDVAITNTARAQFLATRIPVTATVDGAVGSFILDSGASNTVLRTTAFDALVSDGRHTLDGLPLATVMGSTTSRAARVHDLDAGGASVANSPVISATDIDTLLDKIAAEVHHPVDGLLGGDYLREFLVTIDYPAGALVLQRYGTRAHIVDDFQRVGAQLTPSSQVGLLFPGSDAATKLQLGDVVVSIDGVMPVDGLAADHALDGTPGTMKSLVVTRGGSSQNISVRVDDLLPLP